MLKDSPKTSNRFVNVGRIIKSVGLEGDVLVDYSIEPSFFALEDKPVWIVPPVLGQHETSFASILPQKDRYRVHLSGVDSIDVAKPLAAKSLIMRSADVPSELMLPALTDPVELGYEVYSEQWGFVGTITEVIITKANDVWVVDGAYGEVLLPVIESVVLAIDDDARRIEVEVLSGLIEGDPK